MKTRSTEISSMRVPGSSPMYSSMRSTAGRSVSKSAQFRNTPIDRRDHSRIRSPGNKRRQPRGINFHDRVILRSGIGSQGAPAGDSFVPIARDKSPALHISESSLVRRDHRGSRSGLDAHVAQGHPAFHGEPAHRLARVLDHMAGGAVDADLSNHSQGEILRAHSLAQLAAHIDLHALRLALRQALRSQNMLDFRRSNAKCQRPKRAVRAGMAVAADDGHARLSQSQLRADHVHNALIGRIHIEQRHAEIFAVLLQSLNLPRRNGIGDGRAARLGRNIVIHGRDRAMGLTHLAASYAQSLECLRRSDLVHQMQIDVEQRQLSGGNTDDVLVPDFVQQCELLGHVYWLIQSNSRVAVFQRAGRAAHFGNLLWSNGTPLPLVFWNDGVTARLPSKSLRNKDLYVKYSGIRSYASLRDCFRLSKSRNPGLGLSHR